MPSSSLCAPHPAERSPRAMLPLFRAPPTGSTAAGSQSAAPIGSQQQGYTHLLHHCLHARRRLCPERKEYIMNARLLLLRCYCADTFDSLRCDARSTRRAAGTRAPPQNTHDVRTACAVRMRGGDASCRGTAPALWVLQALGVVVPVSASGLGARDHSSRPVFRYTTGRPGRLGGASPAGRPRGPRSC